MVREIERRPKKRNSRIYHLVFLHRCKSVRVDSWIIDEETCSKLPNKIDPSVKWVIKM